MYWKHALRVLPELFSICRAQFELIELLLRTMVYIRAIVPSPPRCAQLPRTSMPRSGRNISSSKQNISSSKQSTRNAWPGGLGVLRTEKRELTSEQGAQKNMPAILQALTGKFSSAQPTKNFKPIIPYARSTTSESVSTSGVML